MLACLPLNGVKLTKTFEVQLGKRLHALPSTAENRSGRAQPIVNALWINLNSKKVHREIL